MKVRSNGRTLNFIVAVISEEDSMSRCETMRSLFSNLNSDTKSKLSKRKQITKQSKPKEKHNCGRRVVANTTNVK
jgi:hypothetical protein